MKEIDFPLETSAVKDTGKGGIIDKRKDLGSEDEDEEVEDDEEDSDDSGADNQDQDQQDESGEWIENVLQGGAERKVSGGRAYSEIPSAKKSFPASLATKPVEIHSRAQNEQSSTGTVSKKPLKSFVLAKTHSLYQQLLHGYRSCPICHLLPNLLFTSQLQNLPFCGQEVKAYSTVFHPVLASHLPPTLHSFLKSYNLVHIKISCLL